MFTNAAADRLLGAPREALLWRDFHDLVHGGSPAGAPILCEPCPILRALRGDAETPSPEGDDAFLRRDGVAFRAAFRLMPILQEGLVTGAVIVFRDVTAQKEHEAELQLAGAALDAVDMPVFCIARDGSIRHANHAAAQHLGRAEEEIKALRVFDVEADLTRAGWDAHWQRVHALGALRRDGRHRTRDGRLVPVLVDITAVTTGAGEFHVVVARPRDA